MEDKGVLHVPAFDLPVSDFLDPEVHSARERWRSWLKDVGRTCRPENRKCWDENFYRPLVARYRNSYEVRIDPRTIAGVYTEVVTPAAGVSARNRGRVLVNLHGGGFTGGARYGGQIESIPMAAIGDIKVVSIDYRLAPEYRFPAATEDVVAVYRELLRNHNSESIGIYGCSAGAVLAAQTVAWLQKEDVSLPGAVGLFCGAADYWSAGDSGHLGAALAGTRIPAVHEHPYFENTDANDPLVFPMRSSQMLARFPPTLLMSATRDHAFSSVAHTHSRLIALGVIADLNVWDGLDHAFFFDPDLPQSRDVYAIAAKFFDAHLLSLGAA